LPPVVFKKQVYKAFSPSSLGIFVASFAAVSLPSFIINISKAGRLTLRPIGFSVVPRKKNCHQKMHTQSGSFTGHFTVFFSPAENSSRKKSHRALLFYPHLRGRLGCGGIPVFSQVHASTSAHNRSSCCHLL
jgi:hypothetical protein